MSSPHPNNNNEEEDLSDEEILICTPSRDVATKDMKSTATTAIVDDNDNLPIAAFSLLSLSPPTKPSSIPTRVVTANRILIILDLNGILIHRIFAGKDRKSHPHHLPREADTMHNQSYLFMRHHAKKFLSYLLTHFDVAIWSAAQRSNVMAMVELILHDPHDLKKLIFIYDQSHCTLGPPGMEPEKKHKPTFLKELDKVWQQFPQYKNGRTLLIDDAPYKCVRNPPYTAIHPVEMTLDTIDDDILAVPSGRLTTYLTRLLTFCNTNVQTVTEFVQYNMYE